jgi:predicted oxidoreductase
MNYVKIKKNLEVSEIALGCWRMDALSDSEALKVVENALDNGINFFDNADIYGGGVSEEKFGRSWKSASCSRDQIFIQSKAGIFMDENYYDFSKKHLLEAVDGSLKRLQTDYLDVLLLHRPDTLYEPEEVAEAFTVLEQSGKVRYFGVSNQNPTQIELLCKYVKQELIFNQMQFSVMHTGLVDAGLCVNNRFDSSIDRDGGALEYCRLKEIKLQAWSPFQYGFFEGVYLDNPKFPKLNAAISAIAEKQAVPGSAVAAAWILRHPAFAQCIVGTMNPDRLTGICKASQVRLTTREWYDIYKAAGNIIP